MNQGPFYQLRTSKGHSFQLIPLLLSLFDYLCRNFYATKADSAYSNVIYKPINAIIPMIKNLLVAACLAGAAALSAHAQQVTL